MCHDPRAFFLQQLYQVWLRYIQRLWSSGGGNKRVHHLYHQASLDKSIKKKHIYSSILITFVTTRTFLRHFWLEILKKSPFGMIFEYTDIPKGLFMDMFDLCLENSYFLCKGKFYKVKIGVPMGASSSVPIS
jgi:hypothetical protein